MDFPRHYRLNDDHSVELVRIESDADLIAWARLVGSEQWRVAWTEVADGVTVSTIFLGLDHNFFGKGPPILFETMIFDDYGGGDQFRYSTWDEAIAGHNIAVECLRNRLQPAPEKATPDK